MKEQIEVLQEEYNKLKERENNKLDDQRIFNMFQGEARQSMIENASISLNNRNNTFKNFNND